MWAEGVQPRKQERMHTQADKSQKNTSHSVANEVSQKRNAGESAFLPIAMGIVDNRPEAATQRKVQEMANSASAQHSPPIQMLAKTKITHHNGTFKGAIHAGDQPEEVGLKMTALLNPLDPVQGSEPPTDNPDMYAHLYKSNGIVRGHLLNHDLGGHGAPANLFPITGGANSRHSDKVESEVKNLLYDTNKKKGQETGVYYNVDVKNNSNKDSGFICEWGTIANDDTQTKVDAKTISSDYDLGVKKDGWGGFGGKHGKVLSSWDHVKDTKYDPELFAQDQQRGAVEVELFKQALVKQGIPENKHNAVFEWIKENPGATALALAALVSLVYSVFG